MKVSGAGPPASASSSAPPSAVSASVVAARPAEETRSKPARALTISWSRPASAPVSVSGAVTPATVAPPFAPATSIVSSNCEPLTIARSVAASASPRLAVTAWSVVPARSSVVSVSAPASARTSTCSSVPRSSATPPTSRTSRARSWLGESRNASSAREPSRASVSRPVAPSIVSLPSPASQSKRSSPGPSRPVSLPRRPSTRSLPSPAISRSAPRPPSRVSAPRPPSSVVRVCLVKTIRDSSIRTRSLPAPARTRILSKRRRFARKSAVPLSPTSISSLRGRARSASRSPAPLPVMVSVRFLIATEYDASAASAVSRTAAVSSPAASRWRGAGVIRGSIPSWWKSPPVQTPSGVELFPGSNSLPAESEGFESWS